MAPKSWASMPQAAFLSSYLPLYETYQTSVRQYQPFWDKVNAEYLERWPVLSPGVSAESLDKVEFKVYSNNLNKLYSRIKEWFRWRCNNRSRNMSNKVTSKEMKDIYSEGTRNAKKYELFVKQNPNIFQPKYWEKLPAILSKTVTPAVCKAGVSAFVTIAGPVLKAGVLLLSLTVTSLQFGDKEETPLFSSMWADHNHVLVNQLASFASRYEFRSLLHAEKTEVVAQDAPNSVKTAGAKGENGESEGLASSSSESVDLPADAIPSTNPDPSAVNLTNDQPQPEVSTESSSSTAQSADLLGLPPNAMQALDIISSQAPDATGGTANTNRNSFDLSRYDLTDFSIANDWQEDKDMWADPEILEAISWMNALNIEDWSPAASSTTMSTVLGQPSPKSVNVHVPDLSTPHNNLLPGSDGSMIAPPALNSISTTASAMLIAPAPNMSAIALPPLHAPVPDMSPPAPLPLPAPSSTAATAFLNSSAPAPPAINMSIMALSTLHSTATNVAVATPALPANVHSPIPTHSTISATSSLSAFPTFPLQTTNASTPAPGLTPGAVSNSASPAVTSSNIVPTTWSSGDFMSAQFNSVPPPSTTHKVDQTADNKEPTWFAPDLAHLKRTDLGASWIILLEKWAEHENGRGWKSGKGLPAKGRPEEWSQWATKARHGVRNYENIPNITDPNDLGIAVVKWVQSFHPLDFGRTGPHGDISLLTLMAWWGTAVLTPSSWNDDSRPQWQALVKELLDQFDHLLSAKSAAKRPREDDILGKTHENKR
ncbi:hypothetical protein H1R20_g7974, partial [Candolleomyces eurysporus]